MPKRLLAGNVIPRTKPDWLWRGRLMFGALSLLEGDPDKGKSTLMCDLAARVSTGAPMPGEDSVRDPAAVVFLSSEDDAGMTLVPRCAEANADLTKVYFLDPGERDTPLLSDDGAWLEEECVRVGAKLVVVDPLVAFIGSRRATVSVDTNNDMLVRQALAPLDSIARRLKASIVGIRHLNKSGNGKAIYRGGGSIAFTAAARSVLTAGNGQAGGRQLGVAKSNLAKPQDRKAIAYEIVSSPNDPEVPIVEWGLESLDTADDILGADQMDAAIRAALRTGPKPADELSKLAEELGTTQKTLRRHADKLGVKRVKGPSGQWTWDMTSDSDDQSEGVSEG